MFVELDEIQFRRKICFMLSFHDDSFLYIIIDQKLYFFQLFFVFLILFIHKANKASYLYFCKVQGVFNHINSK